MAGGFGSFGTYNPIGMLPVNMQHYVGGANLPTANQQQNQGMQSAWPGFGYGGMPGRHNNAYGGGYGGGGYGGAYGGGAYGYGGFSPFGYGPGSYSPYGAGAMGYGGGSGMYGGPPMAPFTGFGDFNQLAQQLAGTPEANRMAPIRPSYTPATPVQGTAANPAPPPPPRWLPSMSTPDERFGGMGGEK